MLIKSTEMSNTIPDQKVMATYLTYLAVRLLDLSVENEAARVIQLTMKRYVRIRKEERVRDQGNSQEILPRDSQWRTGGGG